MAKLSTQQCLKFLCFAAPTPKNLNSGLKIFIRCPLLELPSSINYPNTISKGSESSKHIFSAIDIDQSPYLSTLSHILELSKPS